MWTLSSRIAYNIPLRSTAAQNGAGPAAQPRYRMNVYVSVNNLTNHANLTGYSGVMTSGFFLQPTGVQNPLKVDIGLNINL